MEYFFQFYIFYIGACLSSFLYLAAMRLPRNEKIGWTRSRCDYCQTELTMLDLFPIFSFIHHKGKCRYCGISLPFAYPLAEFLGGILFLLVFLHYTTEPVLLLLYGLVYVVLFMMGAIDSLYFILPDRLQIIFLFLIVLLQFHLPAFSWKTAFVGFLGIFTIGIVSSLIVSDGLGGGDLKLMAIFGFAVGLWDASFILFLASSFGIFFFMCQWLFQKKKPTQEIPFGPFLIFSFFLFMEGPFLISLFKLNK